MTSIRLIAAFAVVALAIGAASPDALAQTTSAAACGAASGSTFSTYAEMTGAGLCSSGTATSITGTASAWAWSCVTSTSAVACSAAVTGGGTCTTDWCLSALYLEKRDGTNTKDTQTVQKGGTATFTISIMNGGYIPLTNVRVTDLLAPDCNRTAVQMAQLYGASFEPGEIISYTCSLPNVQESFDNVATVTAITPNDGTVLTVCDDTHVDVTVPPAPIDGVCGPAHGTTVETTPTGGLCSVGTPTPVIGSGPWSWQCVGSNGGKTVICGAYKLIPANPAISLTKSNGTNSGDSQTIVKNGTATFKITVKNTGNVNLTNVVITDQLAPDCNRTAAQTAQLYGDAFTPGESFHYTCTKNNVQESFTNVAVVTGDAGDKHVSSQDTSHVTVETPVTHPAITIDKKNGDGTADTQTITKGETAHFTITVKNTGDVNLTNVVVQDQLAPDCNRNAAQTAQLYGDAFTPGETFSYTCKQENVQASFTNVIVVHSETPGDDTDPSDEDDTDVVVPTDHPSLNVEKRNGNNSGDTQTIAKGETAHFTITVKNTGNVNLTTVVVKDQLAPDCNRTAAQTAQLYGDAFTPGETFSYTCKQDNVQSSFKNVVVVSSDTPGTPDDSDDTDVVVPPEKPKNPGIEVQKRNGDNSGDAQTVLKGGTATFTITVKNTGDVNLTNVTITDQFVPDCNRTAAQTAQLYGDAFTPGETFSYTCKQDNVQASYRNVVVVKGETPDGGTPDDSDDTTVTVPGEEPKKPTKPTKEKCDASIGDLVWNDTNKNGIQDNGERGIADVRLKLYNGDDVERDKTSGSGNYKFKNLCEGTYTVVVDTKTLPQGCYPTYDYDGKLDHKTKKKLDNDEHFKKADFGYYCPTKVTGATQSPKTGVGTTSAAIATGMAMTAAYITNRRMKRA